MPAQPHGWADTPALADLAHDGLEGEEGPDVVAAGDPEALKRLLPLLYDELRKLAAAKMAVERPGQTLDATALALEPAAAQLVREGTESLLARARSRLAAFGPKAQQDQDIAKVLALPQLGLELDFRLSQPLTNFL